MSVVSVRARSFILALFIRDDGERFLLGDRGFDFKDSQLHFSANTIENDEVEKQGVDGVMLAGQVRRASVQSFDGYVGDATTLKEEVEQMRRDFIAFFAKGHHFRVIYIDCNRNAWQRKGGYLVDAPEVKELWQIHPEYHVGLNFEDVNYYEYDENADGQEILANIMKLPISSDVEGGLVWDENGAVSEPAEIEYDTETATASGTDISIADAVEAPLKSLEIQGNTSQQTYSGKNLMDTYSFVGKNAAGTLTVSEDGVLTLTENTNSNGWCGINKDGTTLKDLAPSLVAGNTYYLYLQGENLARTHIYLNGSATQWSHGQAHTITQAELDNFVVIYGGYNTTTKFKIMVTTALDGTYEKYVGGTASPNPDYPQAVQTVTGENVVKITGKNLAKMANGAYSYSAAGQTFTLLDGSITTTRTNGSYQGGAINISTGALNRWSKNCASDSHLTGSGGTYTLTFSRTGDVVSSSSPRACIYGFIYDNDGNNTSGNGQLLVDLSSQTSGTYTLNLDADRHLGALVFYSQFISYSDVEFKLQLELGSTATAYEPYQEQSYEVNLGKNLFDKDNVVQGIPQASDGSIGHTTGAGRTCQFIPVMPNTQYTHSGHPQGWAVIAYYRADKSFISRVGDVTTITTPSDCFYASVSCAVDNLSTCQFEKGSQATSYAAYFTPIELCKIGTYQDYIRKSGGKWYVRKEIGKIPSYAGETISTDYISTTGSLTTGATIYYALATPTDTEITNEALIEQLEAILSQGSTHAGTNNITTVISEGNAQGELEITYYTKYDAKVVSGYVWEAGGSGGPTIVTNESISAVSPVWTVFGPALNPMLENTTTGEQIQYVGMISEGQTLVVDMGEQTARLDGLNVISNIVGEYLTLAPGSNTLLFSADSDAPASEIGWSEIVG